jgi:hypothetical protein
MILRVVLRLVEEGLMFLALVSVLFGREFFQYSTLPGPDAPHGLLLRDAIFYNALFWVARQTFQWGWTKRRRPEGAK